MAGHYGHRILRRSTDEDGQQRPADSMGFDRCGVSDRMGGRIVSGPEVGRWVAMQMNGTYGRDNSTAIGLETDNGIIAGVIYENWNGKSLVVHLAIKGRVTRSFLGAIFRYGFVTCGIEKAIAPISSGNQKIISFVKKVGFIEEARITDAAPDGDIILYTLKKADCRYLGERYG